MLFICIPETIEVVFLELVNAVTENCMYTNTQILQQNITDTPVCTILHIPVCIIQYFGLTKCSVKQLLPQSTGVHVHVHVDL